MPTFKQLEALRWTARLNSFEKAAERLNTTQSAISKRIQELEADLGTSLFDRSQRRTQLTAKGELILALGEEMLDLRTQALSVARSQATFITKLRFGITEMTALTWLPAFVAEVRSAYPGITLEPEVDQSAGLVEQLRGGALDFVVVPDSFHEPGIESFPLANIQNHWLCSPTLIRHRGIMRLKDLAAYNILTQGDRSGSGIIFDKWMRQCGVEPPRVIRSNSVIALVGLTLAAIGVSYLPKDCFLGLIEQGRLQVIETDPPLPALSYVLAFRRDEHPHVVDAVTRIAQSTCDFSRPVRWA